MNRIIAIISCLLLSACALTQDAAPTRVFVLNPARMDSSPRPLPATLTVTLPNAAPGLDTDKIILFTTANALDFYADAQWATRLPEMTRAALLGTFEDSKLLTAVTGEATGVNAGAVMLTEIRRFEARYDDGSAVPTAHVALVTKLLMPNTRKLTASFKSEAAVQAKADKIADVVQAFDEAFAIVQKDIVNQTMIQLRATPTDIRPKSKRHDRTDQR